MATATAPRVDPATLLKLVEKAAAMDSVELKMSVPDNQRTALADIGIDPMGAQIRQVYFFDTPGLDLFKKGVVVRARRNQGDDDDTVVKLRPVDPAKLPKKVRGSKNFKVEMDVTSAGYVVSGSMKGTRKAGMVQEALSGKRSLDKLFTKEQRDFFDEFAVDCPDWQELVALGPINVIKLKFNAKGVSERVTVEQWHYPGQMPAVELSTKTAPRDAMKLAEEARGFLTDHGLSAGGQQEPKTRKALEFLVERLASKQKAASSARSNGASPSGTGKAPSAAKAATSKSRAKPRTSSRARTTGSRSTTRTSSTTRSAASKPASSAARSSASRPATAARSSSTSTRATAAPSARRATSTTRTTARRPAATTRRTPSSSGSRPRP